MKLFIFGVIAGLFIFSNILHAYSEPTAEYRYFSCEVKESLENNETVIVVVKFAVRNLDIYSGEGELIQYPGGDEENGPVFVTPSIFNDGSYSKMSNLNGQGGDLRIEGDHLRLFGDGAGYQFTDLVIWDVAYTISNSNEELTEVTLEGYVRDYGSVYGETESFKQFISCITSKQKL